MPLTKREVTPTDVSVHRIPECVRTDELECVGNGSLANLVRQLSSLSKHAEDIFTELFREAVKIEHRTNTLGSRMERLTLKATQLESQEEEVSIENLHLTKHYRTNQFIDQGSLNRSTMPSAMAECYSRCDAPPLLDKLNHYRDSEIPALKMYTDPDYFYNLWKIEMLKDGAPKKNRATSRSAHKTGATASSSKSSAAAGVDAGGGGKGGGGKRRPRPPADHRQKYLDQVIKGGAIMDLPAEYHTPEYLRQQQSRYNHLPMQEPPRGMVIPSAAAQHSHEDRTAAPPPSVNGVGVGPYSSGYGSQDSSLQRQQQQPPPQQQQQRYQYTANSQDRFPRVSAQQRSQYLANQTYYEPSPPVTSQYMSAGYAVDAVQQQQQQQQRNYYDQQQHSQMSAASAGQPYNHRSDSDGGFANTNGNDLPQSPDRHSNDSGGRPRPAHAPPAPPPSSQAPPYRQLERLQLASSNGGEHLRNGAGVRGSTGSPDLPPPPPPLSTDELACMQASVASTITSDGGGKLPSPPPLHGGPGGGYIPPAPPPPPPTAQKNGATVTAVSPEKAKMTASMTAQINAGVLFNSALLKQIQDGKKLKKVSQKEEKERERAQTESGHDVAAILKKRMEKVMGTSDSDDSDREFDDDDWSDD